MGKNENRKHKKTRTRLGVITWVLSSFLCQSFMLCSSLNDEGLALLRLKERVVNDPFGALTNWTDDHQADPCSWFGVECLDGNVVVLNLKDLCLEGTLPSDLGNLVHIKTIMLRNNSFNGRLPEGFGKLKNLEFLDLGFNNFTGSVPDDLCRNLSLKVLLLDNNGFLGSLPPEFQLLSEYQVDKNHRSEPVQRLSGCGKSHSRSVVRTARKLDQVASLELQTAPPTSSTQNPPGPGDPTPKRNGSPPTPSTNSPAPSPHGDRSPPPPYKNSAPLPDPKPAPPPNNNSAPPPDHNSGTPKLRTMVLAAILVGIVLLLSAMGLFLWKTNKLTSLGPWALGLTGQLQKAFAVGVPKLKRLELKAACEDFSNVICSSPVGSLYKGTLSSGIEIAVASVAVESVNDWSKSLEVQFRRKIDTLSKAKHKNFISLLGYCEEEEPFTRMVVLEYAPNGTLFEHLHVQEAEHLDWAARLRIAMGVAYCLDHLHQLKPPLIYSDLTSMSVNLTEDYAAKISEFGFSNEMDSSSWSSVGLTRSTASIGGPKSNVRSFGMILFEIVTGRMLKSVEADLREDEKAFLRGTQPLREMVDPTLTQFQIDELEQIGGMIRWCLKSDPKKRPSMAEVSAKLKSITGITPDEAVPKDSPLWWAELETMSVGG